MTERDDDWGISTSDTRFLPRPAQREQADVTAEDRAAAVLALFGGWEVSELQRAMDWAARGSVNHWPLTREEAREVGVWARVLARHRIAATADLRARLDAAERELHECRVVGYVHGYMAKGPVREWLAQRLSYLEPRSERLVDVEQRCAELERRARDLVAWCALYGAEMHWSDGMKLRAAHVAELLSGGES